MALTLTERFKAFKQLSDALMSTNSIVQKKLILESAPNALNDDLQYIFEILAGQHKFGFTYQIQPCTHELPEWRDKMTIREYLKPLNEPNLKQDWSTGSILKAMQDCRWFGDIVEPVVNRTLKLGIGKSLLPKTSISAMLGKAYEGVIKSTGPLYVTEKLDGNRCIAMFDGVKWNFVSRNGKFMKVNFNMEGLPTDYIYDGEVMSRTQTVSSILLHSNVLFNRDNKAYLNDNFNSTSGLINSKYGDKSELVYNIFDIIDDVATYEERREVLDTLDNTETQFKDWRILPVLNRYDDNVTFTQNVHHLLDKVTSMGAEGLMINIGNAKYQHKRTNNLLKYKKVKTMDLKVTGITYGTGKYEGMVGALDCVGEFDKKIVMVSVGSGLSDEQRMFWSENPKLIVGKIVEVAYFSESQNNLTNGTIYYSLRFPRLKKIRDDKIDISQY